MNAVPTFFIRIGASILAILIGCIGVAMLEENPLGWLLAAFGVAYPSGVTIYFYRRQERHNKNL